MIPVMKYNIKLKFKNYKTWHQKARFKIY